jgi:hypothetical protein
VEVLEFEHLTPVAGCAARTLKISTLAGFFEFSGRVGGSLVFAGVKVQCAALNPI